MNRRETLLLGLASLSSLTTEALGQTTEIKSDRLVRLIVPRPAGGVTDVIARHLAERAGPRVGNMVVFNLGGAGGAIGTATAAKAQPDGKTLLLGGTSDVVINPLIADRVAEIRTLMPVAMLANTITGILINPIIPVKSLPELVAFMKANPGKLSYASPGSGTVAHLGGELFKQIAGVPDVVHVPYKGSSPMLADLSAGHVSIAVSNLTDSTIALHWAGKIRILVAASDQRVSVVPDVPTSAEVGYPELQAQLFLGLFAPEGTPEPMMRELTLLVRQVMADRDFQQILVKQGFEPVLDSSPEKARKFVQEEYERWGPLVKSLGLKG
jgi:tripartite-type tricarboxylate transporter receptor subunit TctC